jgi:hypothetical protein
VCQAHDFSFQEGQWALGSAGARTS